MSDTMSNMSFVPLPGSERRPIPSAVPAGSLDGSERIEITIVTRRKAELPRTASGVPVRLSRDELRQQYGSDPADQALVADVLTGLGLGLEVTSRDPGSRRLKVAGPVSALARAFGTTLSLVTSTGPGQSRPVTHRYRQGGLQIPAQLAGVVVAVLGLDNRPQARPHVRRAELAAQQVSYTPPQVAAIYQFPEGTDGTGQTIAIIEFGGGFVDTDLDTYFPSLGLAVPSVTVVGVDGASNGGVEGQDPPDDYFEVALDIEVAGSVAPGAALVVYFAPGSDQGWLDAVSEAIQATPTPTAVSISWGGSEDNGDAQGNAALDAVFADAVALGVNVCVSSGDGGSSDGVGDGNPHCDFPASSPHVLACGGTSLQADPATGVISSETVWNDSSGVSGGGVSDVFAPPAWQAAAGVSANPGGGTGRGVPDVAGNADPGTGYLVLFNNNQLLGGGTSAVAPLWAALTCRWAQAVGGPLGFLPERLYAGVQAAVPAPGFFDITQGNNGAYSAGPGWDACTGLGSPNGSALLGLSISPSLTARDPLASPNAQSVYAQLVAMENAARAGSSPMTIIGQHIEGQNELYNPGYGDTGGTTYVGYYYNKVEAITGKLPAFVEIDVGPGYGSANGWGIFNERSYDSSQDLPAAQKQWQYVDDAVDLAFGVWKGFPRADDGTYNYNGLAVNIDGSTSVTAPLANGGSAAGIVGSSFHQPYPGSALKDFSQVLDQVQGQPPGGSQYGYPAATISTDQDWFDSVVDWNDNTPQYQELLADLSVLAAQLSYFAEYDIPVLFRPYHEMNSGSFWWGNKTAASYQGLWQIMYNYLVNTSNLHNLIFVWSPGAWTPDGSDVPWNYYPGDGYVDIVAVTDYNAQEGNGASTPETASFTNIYYTALAGYAKPRMLAETYSVPIDSSTADGNALTASPWVIWSVWGDLLTSSNSNAAVKDSYYATEYIYTGGSGPGYGQNFNWGSVHAD